VEFAGQGTRPARSRCGRTVSGAGPRLPIPGRDKQSLAAYLVSAVIIALNVYLLS
jgi:hypothetical protein